MILCVAGNPSIDKVFEVDRVRPGEIHRPQAFVQVPGGKGLNVARSAKALGTDVLATGILCGHAGRWMAAALAEEGIAGRFAWAGGETRSSLSVADRETLRLTEFYEDGAPLEPGDWERLEAVVESVVAGASWVTVSGSQPPGAPPSGYRRLIEMARAAGAHTALDARGASLAWALPARPDVVKVNAEEAAEVLGVSASTEGQALAAAEALRRLAGGGHRAAVVTRGAKGAVLAAPDGTRWRGTLGVWGPYPVGSGDAFLAGLVTALDRAEEWPGPLRLALAAAAANAQLAGAGRLEAEGAGRFASLAVIERVDEAKRTGPVRPPGGG